MSGPFDFRPQPPFGWREATAAAAYALVGVALAAALVAVLAAILAGAGAAVGTLAGP